MSMTLSFEGLNKVFYWGVFHNVKNLTKSSFSVKKKKKGEEIGLWSIFIEKRSVFLLDVLDGPRNAQYIIDVIIGFNVFEQMI